MLTGQTGSISDQGKHRQKYKKDSRTCTFSIHCTDWPLTPTLLTPNTFLAIPLTGTDIMASSKDWTISAQKSLGNGSEGSMIFAEVLILISLSLSLFTENCLRLKIWVNARSERIGFSLIFKTVWFLLSRLLFRKMQ